MYSVQGIFYVFQDDFNVQRVQKRGAQFFRNLLKPPEVYVYQRLLSNNLPLPVRSGLLLVVLARLLLAKHRLKHQGTEQSNPIMPVSNNNQDTMAPAAADAPFLPPTLPPNLLKTSNKLVDLC